MGSSMLRIVALLGLFICSVNALDNGLALTPPMGFMSWAQFRCNIDCKNDPDNCISEKLYTDIADRMVADGYLDAGYQYVIMDDCWMATERDASNRLQPDPDRFPSGIPYLADYMHSRGLLLGIYEDVGTHTCGGYPGTLGHYDIDTLTFAEWEVDYVKLDGCYEIAIDLERDYISFGNYLNATGRPIVYSCSWPAYLAPTGIDPNYSAIETTCNLWRNWYDIENSYDSVKEIYEFYAFDQVELIPIAGPGHWNDPDQLIIGESGLSFDQSQVQMAIWSILASPMLISSDLRTIDPALRNILLNKDAIAVSQDPLGIQGKQIYQVDTQEVWMRPVSPTDGTFYSYAVAFINNGPTTVESFAALSQLGLNYADGYHVTNIFDGTDYGILQSTDLITVSVNSTGAAFLKATLNVL